VKQDEQRNGNMPERKPNFLIVFMDDMGYGDMSCFGSPTIKTPVMDRIAEDGAKFTDMYSNAPICSPARCGLLTGRYPQRVGITNVLFPKDTLGLTDSEKTIAEYLKEAGYATCMTGKWHLGCCPKHLPGRHGFDEYLGLPYSNDMYPGAGEWHAKQGFPPLPLIDGGEVIEENPDQAQLTPRYTDRIIDFAARHREEPLFLYLAHTMPHIPLHVEPSFRGISGGGTYGDTIECIDHHLGRLMDSLDELGLTEDTFVIVTSDNGPWYEGSTGGLRGRKFETYEGGMRMPFVAQYPGRIKPGTVCSHPAAFTDLLPTIVNMAGLPQPTDRCIDGQDIWTLFEGGALTEPHPIYYYMGPDLNAVRLNQWKLHVAFRQGGTRSTSEMPQLFDLEKDPQENYNLADRHQDVVAKLKSLMIGFDREVKAESGLPRTEIPA